MSQPTYEMPRAENVNTKLCFGFLQAIIGMAELDACVARYL